MITLAFIVPITLAVEFNIWVGTTEDISSDPGLQLLYPSTDNILKVIVYFDHAVELQTSHVEISGFDATDTYDPAIVLVPPEQYPIHPEGAHTAFWVRIAVTEGTSKVTLRIAGGIPSHNPINSDTSRELTEEIGVLAGGVAGTQGGGARADIRVDPTTPVTTTVGSGGGTDVIGAPRVYSIRRADNSTLPLASGAVNITITLSEQPQSFMASHINVTNATAGTPVLSSTTSDRVNLLAITTYLISTGAVSAQPSLRTVDELRTVIKNYMNDDPPDAPVPAAFIEAVRALRTAVNTIASPWKYYYINAAGTRMYQTLWNGAVTDFELFPPLVNDAVPPPTTQGTANLTGSSGGVTVPVLAAQFDRSAAEPTALDIFSFDDPAKYHFAQARYNALSSTNADNQRAAYTKEKTAYDTYIVLQNALQAHDVAQQRAWDQEVANAAALQGAEYRESLPPTGRDGLLYQYTVTITPTYANNNSVVVKVNTWQNTDVPPLSYAPPTLEADYTEGFDKLTLQVTGGAAEALEDAKDTAQAQGGFFLVIGAPNLSDRLEREQLQAQIDLLIATGDRSPAAMKTLIYLQQLLAMARPEKTQLLANYPNPFNPETWIPYELATDTEVRLTIYNAQGSVVRTLQLGQQSAGYYTGRDRAAYWDGRNAVGEQVASGVYFYQLETDEMSVLRKMVILK